MSLRAEALSGGGVRPLRFSLCNLAFFLARNGLYRKGLLSICRSIIEESACLLLGPQEPSRHNIFLLICIDASI